MPGETEKLFFFRVHKRARTRFPLQMQFERNLPDVLRFLYRFLRTIRRSTRTCIFFFDFVLNVCSLRSINSPSTTSRKKPRSFRTCNSSFIVRPACSWHREHHVDFCPIRFLLDSISTAVVTVSRLTILPHTRQYVCPMRPKSRRR